MKRVYIAILTIILLLTGVVSANNSLLNWEYYKNVELQGNNKYKYILLNQDIYKYSKSNLSDLRVVDSNGQFVPYYLSSEFTDINRNNTTYGSNLNEAFKKGHDSYFDFKIIPPKENSDVSGNILILYADKKEFYKKIELFGSYDGMEWNYLLSDNIYNVKDVSKNSISLTDICKFDYYRVKVNDNIDNTSITEAKLVYQYATLNKNNYKKTADLKYEIKNENKRTIINVFNDSKLNISSIKFDIKGSFSRHYDVYRKDGDIYNILGHSGELYNFEYKSQKLNNTQINFNYPVNNDFLQIRINNLDDKPLDITKISQEYYIDKLVFEASGDTQYRVYFGNSKAERPVYDIYKYKDYIERESQDICSLGETNIVEKPLPEKEFNFKMMYDIMILFIVALLIALIAAKLKVTKKQR